MEITQEQKLFTQVVEKAWEDAEFKKELVANPIAAIEKLTGHTIELPEGKTLVVRDQSSEDKVYVNIPALPEVDAELNDAELEKVAGGCQVGDSGMGPKPWTPVLPKPYDFITI
jgi:hypothetical protein